MIRRPQFFYGAGSGAGGGGSGSANVSGGTFTGNARPTLSGTQRTVTPPAHSSPYVAAFNMANSTFSQNIIIANTNATAGDIVIVDLAFLGTAAVNVTVFDTSTSNELDSISNTFGLLEWQARYAYNGAHWEKLQSAYQGGAAQSTNQPFGPPRATSIAYASSITPVCDTTDIVIVGTLTAAITINAPTGNPNDGQKLRFRFTQDGTGGWVITYNALFAFGSDITAALDPTAAGSKWERNFTYCAADSTWRADAIVRGF